MAEFKIGDKWVRKESLIYGGWELDCARNDRSVSEVFTVSGVWGDLLQLDGLPGHWKNDCFRPATGLDEHQSSALSAEDRLRESDAHIECLRELLDIEKRRVSELQAEVSRCCGTVADKVVMEDKIAKLLKYNTELRDQCDAAVLAAKTLGDEVQKLRQERREFRMGMAELRGILSALEDGVADVDLLLLSSQLDQIGRMCDEQGNGADAKLAFDAAQVVDMVERTLDKFADE